MSEAASHLRQERRDGDLLHDLAGERVERLQAPLVLDGDEPEPLELEGSREGQVRGIGSRGLGGCGPAASSGRPPGTGRGDQQGIGS